MARRRPSYHVTARQVGTDYWALTVDEHPEWAEGTAFRSAHIEYRAYELIALHTGMEIHEFDVEFRIRTGRK